MTKKPGIFPTFFISGFECSTFDWKDKGRRNLIRETGHDVKVYEDYQLLRSLGIAVAREGVPWPLVDQNGNYDFSCLETVVDALNKSQILPIWDLCHYGYPDGLDPFSENFCERFADYCRAAAEYLIAKLRGPYFLPPSMKLPFSLSVPESGDGWLPIKLQRKIASI